MALELFVKQYSVIERGTRTEHDAPFVGDSLEQDIFRDKYGPYFSRIDARKKIALLKVDRIEGGWEQTETNPDILFKKDAPEISYLIETSFAPF